MAVENILVVDDSKSARIMLSRMLQKLGKQVSAVDSGEEALTYLNNNTLPDLVFMDHMMPGIDGLEATRQIKSDPAHQQLPVFMYTSKEGADYEAEVLASGARGMLGKPATAERLNEILKQMESEEPEKSVPASDAGQVTSDEKEAEVSRELIEQVSGEIVASALENAIKPLSEVLVRMEAQLKEQSLELETLRRKVGESHQDGVSEALLSARLQQHSVQNQQQLSHEIKRVIAEVESRSGLDAAAKEQVREIAQKAGAQAGAEKGKKAANSSAEGVAAKVGAAQAQVQVQQQMAPIMKRIGGAQMMSVLALIVGGIAIAMKFLG